MGQSSNTIISWHVQTMIMNGFGLVLLIWPMWVWVILGQICGQGVTKISWCDDLPNFSDKNLPQATSIEPINSILIHAIISWYVQTMIMNGYGLVIWPMWVMLGQICGQYVTKISWCDLPNFSAKILPGHIHRANQFHAHPCHHLLICSDNDNEWFWVCHLANVSHAGSDLWSGCEKNQLMWFAQLFSQNPPTRRHP
jgi:hypothetical protein